MMNIQNPGSKESLEVKFNDGQCTRLCLKLWFESRCYFCNITESRWFWKQLSGNKFPDNHFVKSVQKQPYANVLQNRYFTKILNQEKHLYWSLFLIKLQALWSATLWKRLQHRCFPVIIAKFLRTTFFIEYLLWLHLSVSSLFSIGNLLTFSS